MAATREIRVPDIGDFEDVEVIDVLVSTGDKVAPEDPLITLESDKAAMDVPSPLAGTVRSIEVAKGDKVSEGSLILTLALEEQAEQGGEESEEEDKRAERAAPSEPQRAPEREAPAEPRKEKASDAKQGGGRAVIKVPDIGDFEDVEVIDLLVAEGEQIDVETPLVTLESDKAAMDVPSPQAGRIVELRVSKGDKVSEGDPLVVLETAGGAQRAAEPVQREPAAGKPPPKAKPVEPEPKPAAAPEQPARHEPPTPARGALPPIDEPGFARAHASPSVRKFARELGVDLAQVKGSGAKGRVTHDDVKGWVKAQLKGEAGRAGAALPKLPEIDFSQFGEIETRELSRIQRIAGPRLQASWVNIPHVAQFDEADITELEQRRKELKDAAEAQGIKLTPLGFILKACVDALKEFPTVNASLAPDGEHLILKKYFHLGFAVDTPNGLIVPVIRDVDRKDIYEIARELADLSDRARNNKLKRADLQGGCFTISSLGGIGGTGFTPIINPPEVAILGVARATMKPVWQDGEFVPRLMLPFSFCYDHRVIDGALAVRFTRYLAERLADVQALTQAIP